jgi:hypothetical protein
VKAHAHREGVVQKPGLIPAPLSFLTEVAAGSSAPPGTALYLFGSFARGQAAANDVDVLVVYPDGHLHAAHLLAESIRNAATPFVFDVLVLSSSEERELAFIQTQQGLRIWPDEAAGREPAHKPA